MGSGDPEGQKKVAGGDRVTREPPVYQGFDTAPAGAGDSSWLSLNGFGTLLASLPGRFSIYMLSGDFGRASLHPRLLSFDPPGRNPLIPQETQP